jgi:hypothetical protein
MNCIWNTHSRAAGCCAHHDDVLGGFDAVSGERLGDADGRGLRIPVDDLEKLLAHHTVVLAGEVETLLDLHSVDVDERLASDLVRDLGDVPTREAGLETLLKRLLQTRHGDQRVFRTFVADDATYLFFDGRKHSHVAVVT